MARASFPLRKGFFAGLSKLYSNQADGLAALLNHLHARTDLTAITPIADPATASTQEVAEKLNEIIAASNAAQ